MFNFFAGQFGMVYKALLSDRRNTDPEASNQHVKQRFVALKVLKGIAIKPSLRTYIALLKNSLCMYAYKF